ncbi:hypothetical protein ACOME3_001820 [Neoechinorhynchus agilis]
MQKKSGQVKPSEKSTKFSDAELIELMKQTAYEPPEDTLFSNIGFDERQDPNELIYDTSLFYTDPFNTEMTTYGIAVRQNDPPDQPSSNLQITPICNVKHDKVCGMQVIVVNITSNYTTKSGSNVTTAIVADPSGSMEMTLWDHAAQAVEEGDILLMSSVRVVVFNKRLQLKVSRDGYVLRTGKYCMPFRLLPDYSILPPELEQILQEQNSAKAAAAAQKDGESQKKEKHELENVQ